MVPQKVQAVIPSWICSLQRPKSVNLTWPCASSKTFSGFKSLRKQRKTEVKTETQFYVFQQQPVDDSQRVKMFQGKDDFVQVKTVVKKSF